MELIYCVGDDTSIRDIEIYTLRSTGYEAIGFENGKAFFEAIRTRMPDLVILDIMLPDISGMEILTRLRKDPATLHLPSLPVPKERNSIRFPDLIQVQTIILPSRLA